MCYNVKIRANGAAKNTVTSGAKHVILSILYYNFEYMYELLKLCTFITSQKTILCNNVYRNYLVVKYDDRNLRFL